MAPALRPHQPFPTETGGPRGYAPPSRWRDRLGAESQAHHGGMIGLSASHELPVLTSSQPQALLHMVT